MGNQTFKQLSEAVSKGDVDIVEQLLKEVNNALDINDTYDMTQSTVLHLACEKGNCKVVSALLKHKADIDRVDASTRTPLHKASENGHLEVVKILIASGAKVNAIDMYNHKAIDLAKKGGHKDVVEYLNKPIQTTESTLVLTNGSTSIPVVKPIQKPESTLAPPYELPVEKVLMVSEQKKGLPQAVQTSHSATLPSSAGSIAAILDEQCTNLHIAKIATFLPKWKVVAKQLGLEDQIIRDIEDCYPNGKDQRSEALRKWVWMKGPQATYRKIYDTLCDLEEMEAAEKLKKLTTAINIRSSRDGPPNKN